MPATAPDHAEPGAESFAAILARVARVQERLEARIESERVLCVSHWGFLHFFLGAAIFREDFSPAHLPGAVPDVAHQHRHHDVRASASDYLIEGVALRRLGAADLERPSPPVDPGGCKFRDTQSLRGLTWDTTRSS